MQSLSQFGDKALKLADSIPRRANVIKQVVAASVLETAVTATPVDTSQAKSRWQVGVNASPVAVYGPFFPGKHGSTAQPSSEAAIRAGQIVIARARPGDTIIVGNNVPYINRLNNGYSKQAPANFVQRSASEGIRKLHGLRLVA